MTKREILESIAIAVGIILGVLAMISAASYGMARGTAWQTGDYASAPAWND